MNPSEILQVQLQNTEEDKNNLQMFSDAVMLLLQQILCISVSPQEMLTPSTSPLLTTQGVGKNEAF